MVYYFSPFSVDKDLGKVYNDYMKLVSNENDWVCFTDMDTCFLTSDVGQQIEEIVQLNSNVGLFTCYTNRVGNLEQCYASHISEDCNILNHKQIALQLSRQRRHKLKELRGVISGHMMLIKKKTWNMVGHFPEGRGLLGVDNKFSKRILANGHNIMLMEGVYLFHFYRLDVGIHNKAHLLVS